MSKPYLWQDQRDPRAAIEETLAALYAARSIDITGSLNDVVDAFWGALADEYSLSTCCSAWGDRDSHGTNSGAHECSRPVGHPGRCTCRFWHCLSWRQP